MSPTWKTSIPLAQTTSSVAAQHDPITDFPYKEIQLYNSNYKTQLARTNPLTNGGHAFSVTQLHCN